MHRWWPLVLTATLWACGPQVALDADATDPDGSATSTATTASADITGPVATQDHDVDVDDGTIMDDFGVRPGCGEGPPGVCLDPGPIIPIEIVPLQIADGDLDGDGIDEIIVSGENDPSLLVARLSGDDLVLEAHELPTRVQSHITIGDLDEDGRDDVATVAIDPPSIVVGYGPDLTPSVTPFPLESIWSVTYVRGDTAPALVLTTAGARFQDHATLGILVAQASAGFLPVGPAVGLGAAPWGPIYASHVAPFPGGLPYSCASVIEMHGEFSSTAELRMDIGLGAGAPANTVAPLDGGSHAMALGDVDGDSEPDLFVVTEDTITRYSGDGSITPVAVVGLPGVNALAIGDFDGDGIDDLAAGIEDTGEIWLGVAWADTPTAEGSIASGLFPHEIAVGDFDGNGRDDIVAVDEAGLLAVWLSRP